MEADLEAGIKGIYIVGGCVRDEILNVSYNDIDYAVEAESFKDMEKWIVKHNGKIFVNKPEYGTIRASVKHKVRDFVLCRKDGPYSDKRRPDFVIPGTLYDDLSRRDFTVNAMAKDVNGKIIDPFNGLEDLNTMTLRCVKDAQNCFQEDPLRLLRAFRFHVTKGFYLCNDIVKCFDDEKLCEMLRNHISIERTSEELTKCMKYSTPKTIMALSEHPKLMEACFSNGLWLKPTNEKTKNWF